MKMPMCSMCSQEALEPHYVQLKIKRGVEPKRYFCYWCYSKLMKDLDDLSKVVFISVLDQIKGENLLSKRKVICQVCRDDVDRDYTSVRAFEEDNKIKWATICRKCIKEMKL